MGEILDLHGKKRAAAEDQAVTDGLPLLRQPDVGPAMGCRCGSSIFRLYTEGGAGCAQCGALYRWRDIAPGQHTPVLVDQLAPAPTPPSTEEPL